MLSGRGLCDELITCPEESYRLCCVDVCDLETSRIGAIYIYIYDISSLRVKSESLETHFYLSADFMKEPKVLNVHERTGYCSDRELAVDCV